MGSGLSGRDDASWILPFAGSETSFGAFSAALGLSCSDSDCSTSATRSFSEDTGEPMMVIGTRRRFGVGVG